MNIKALFNRLLQVAGLMLVCGYVMAESQTISNPQSTEGIFIVPPYPTAYDSPSVAIYGKWGCGPVPSGGVASISENIIRIDFAPVSALTVCGLVLGFEQPWQEIVPLDRQLPEGKYEVVVARGEQELGRTSFAIKNVHGMGGGANQLSPREVVCKNITTGKKKAIRDGADAWDCEAAGLKVKPGDKVWMTVKGVANTAP